MKIIIFIGALLLSFSTVAKELALTFDDAPKDTTSYSETHARTEKLIKKLKELKIPGAMIFANPCKRNASKDVIAQLKKYKDAGHEIANHTCTHPRIEDIGVNSYLENIKKADTLLSPLFSDKKFFRYPFLDEGKDEATRDQIRSWLKENNYHQGMVSIDNDDYVYSQKINDAYGKKIDFNKLEKHFVDHVVGAAEFYDKTAQSVLGYSPKHVLLLHEMDATVMFLDALVKELRRKGWKIISAKEAYKDKLYEQAPKNLYAGNGIIAQMAFEKTGEKVRYGKYEDFEKELHRLFGL